MEVATIVPHLLQDDTPFKKLFQDFDLHINYIRTATMGKD